MKEVVIVSAVRTPMGSFGGALSSVPATALGAAAIKGALEKAGLSADAVEEVYMGNVLQANVGQAPARQAAMAAGIGNQVPCTTINKVCSSGMKAIMMGAQAIKAGDVEIIVAGGMENMSAVPHYLPTGRTGVKLGDISLVDGLVKDGLTDVYNAQHMGVCAELCAEEHQFTREDQDAFALESYRRSAAAWDGGKFANEVVPVAVPQRRGDAIVVDTDEEYTKVNTDKVPQLRPVFKKDGTVTAANASTLNDGASAVVLMSASKAAELGLDPIARITGYADAAQEPEWFTTAPAKALPKALAKAGITMDAVDFFEFNEAFSVVTEKFIRDLEVDRAKVNVNGGAMALGHPIGATGSILVGTMLDELERQDKQFGLVTMCAAGGMAPAVILERV